MARSCCETTNTPVRCPAACCATVWPTAAPTRTARRFAIVALRDSRSRRGLHSGALVFLLYYPDPPPRAPLGFARGLRPLAHPTATAVRLCPACPSPDPPSPLIL